MTIYKNLCVNLILVELAIVLIVYRPPIDSAGTGSSVWSFVIPCATHLLLLNVFIWTFIETVRVYCVRARDCDITKLFRCCRWTPTLCLHLIGYGIPLVSIVALGALHPDVYLSSARRHYYWIALNSTAEAVLVFSPALAGVIASLVLLILLLLIRHACDNKHDRSNLRDRSVVPAMVLLLSQTPTWVLANLYFLQQDSTLALTVVFATVNIVQAVVLFVMCFVQNDRVRGNIQQSLSKVQWLPTCVRNGKPSALVGNGHGPSPQTPAYLYSMDPTFGPPPSPLIRQTLQLHNSHLLRHHQQLPHTPSSNTSWTDCPSYISDVNPYAAPMPVPMHHDYEELGTALNSFGVTLPHNIGGGGAQRTQPRHSQTTRHHHQSLRRSVPHEDALYYEACGHGDGGQAVIYGRSNALPNYYRVHSSLANGTK